MLLTRYVLIYNKIAFGKGMGKGGKQRERWETKNCSQAAKSIFAFFFASFFESDYWKPIFESFYDRCPFNGDKLIGILRS